MPELRQNRATKNWIIIATERAKRPDQFCQEKKTKTIPAWEKSCPFCPGNESMTPEEIYMVKNKESSPSTTKAHPSYWSVRVVPNKFAALIPKGNLERQLEVGYFRKMDGFGKHEVIIESPIHSLTVADLSESQAEQIFLTFRQRYLDLAKDGRYSFVTIFRNNGEKAGTSLIHPHAQLVATPLVPTHIRHLLQEAASYYDDHGSCVFCDIIKAELKAQRRVVIDTPEFVVFEPFASEVPFETWVVPKNHNASFGNITEDEARKAGQVLKKILEKMYHKLEDPDYNYVIHTAPFKDANEDYYHWYIQIFPRLTTQAGFELGSGININVALPEDTAEFLRT